MANLSKVNFPGGFAKMLEPRQFNSFEGLDILFVGRIIVKVMGFGDFAKMGVESVAGQGVWGADFPIVESRSRD